MYILDEANTLMIREINNSMCACITESAWECVFKLKNWWF